MGVYFFAFASLFTLCDLGDNCIQNFHLGRYIGGYTFGNLVLRRCVSGAVNRDYRTYIRRYTYPNKNFEYCSPHYNALMQFRLELKRCKPHKAARHPTKCGVYRRIYCRNFLTLSNQMSRYNSKTSALEFCFDVVQTLCCSSKNDKTGQAVPTLGDNSSPRGLVLSMFNRIFLYIV